MDAHTQRVTGEAKAADVGGAVTKKFDVCHGVFVCFRGDSGFQTEK